MPLLGHKNVAWGALLSVTKPSAILISGLSDNYLIEATDPTDQYLKEDIGAYLAESSTEGVVGTLLKTGGGRLLIKL